MLLYCDIFVYIILTIINKKVIINDCKSFFFYKT